MSEIIQDSSKLGQDLLGFLLTWRLRRQWCPHIQRALICQFPPNTQILTNGLQVIKISNHQFHLYQDHHFQVLTPSIKEMAKRVQPKRKRIPHTKCEAGLKHLVRLICPTARLVPGRGELETLSIGKFQLIKIQR